MLKISKVNLLSKIRSKNHPCIIVEWHGHLMCDHHHYDYYHHHYNLHHCCFHNHHCSYHCYHDHYNINIIFMIIVINIIAIIIAIIITITINNIIIVTWKSVFPWKDKSLLILRMCNQMYKINFIAWLYLEILEFYKSCSVIGPNHFRP